MDLNHFETPEVTPVLVKLYDRHRAYEGAQDHKPKARQELTSIVSELLAMDLSSRESELVADVVIALVRQAEIDLKQALSERLSVMTDVSLRLVLELANDEISVARPVLEKSDILGDLDLIYIIKSKTSEYWQSIAKREGLNAPVMETLADTKDVPTVITLIENETLTLSEHTVDVIGGMTESEPSLTSYLMEQDGISHDLVTALYKHVSGALKERLIQDYDVDPQVISDEIDLVFEDVVEEKAPEKTLPKMQTAINEKMLIGWLKERDLETFTIRLSEFCGLNREQCIKAMKQKNGKVLAIICRAKGVQKMDFMSLYLHGAAFADGQNRSTSSRVAGAIEYFDSVRPEKAQQMLNASVEVH